MFTVNWNCKKLKQKVLVANNVHPKGSVNLLFARVMGSRPDVNVYLLIRHLRPDDSFNHPHKSNNFSQTLLKKKGIYPG